LHIELEEKFYINNIDFNIPFWYMMIIAISQENLQRITREVSIISKDYNMRISTENESFRLHKEKG
jgi:hypothetical protein